MPDLALGGNQLVRILEQLADTRGLPKAIRTDNGKELCGRAMLTWALGLPQHETNERCDRAAAVFLAAFHHDPTLLDPVRAQLARIREAVAQDGLKPGHGMAIMAAGDGLFMARIFGLYSLTEAERRGCAVHSGLAMLSHQIELMIAYMMGLEA